MDKPRPREEELNVRRLYCPTLPKRDETCELGADAAQHVHVLRLTVGDALELFDGRGGSVHVRIRELSRRGVRCQAEGEPLVVPPPAPLVLVQCLPRAGKLDEIVRMTTEIGVTSIRLAISERTVAKASDRVEHKVERFMRIAVEAARQSEQAHLPEILPPRPLSEVLAEAPAHLYRCALLERSAVPIPKDINAPGAWLVVGPEGGLSPRDRNEITAAGFDAVSLGSSILRTETAAVVGVGILAERLLWQR